jgi:hypothetical protein
VTEDGAVRPRPKFSRKTGRWTLEVGGRVWTVPEEALDGVIEHVARLFDSDRVPHGLLADLFEQLLTAEFLSRPAKPRGRNAVLGQRFLTTKVRFAAAWGYVFVQAEMEKPPEKRHPAIRRLDARLVKRGSMGAEERKWELTRQLVLRRFPAAEWRKVGLKPPGLETFVRHYLKSGKWLAKVREIVDRNPGLLSWQQDDPDALKAAYLRELLVSKKNGTL